MRVPAWKLILRLKRLYKRGEKLIISEVDGPSYHASHPYDLVMKGKLGDPGIDLLPCTKDIIRACLHNTNRPFGHGYVISTLIRNKEEWLF